MKFKITETREFIIEANNIDEAEAKFIDMTHPNDSLEIVEIKENDGI